MCARSGGKTNCLKGVGRRRLGSGRQGRREERKEKKEDGGRVTQGGNQRMDVRGTGERTIQETEEKGAGRRGEDKETGVRQQNLKIETNVLAGNSQF